MRTTVDSNLNSLQPQRQQCNLLSGSNALMLQASMNIAVRGESANGSYTCCTWTASRRTLGSCEVYLISEGVCFVQVTQMSKSVLFIQVQHMTCLLKT
jgi:hypothetical protein